MYLGTINYPGKWADGCHVMKESRPRNRDFLLRGEDYFRRDPSRPARQPALSLGKRFPENICMQVLRLPIVIPVVAVLLAAAACGQAPPFLLSSSGNPDSTSEPTPTFAPAAVFHVDSLPAADTSANTPEELAYFYEIAFGVEYGRRDTVLHKWTGDVRIKVIGSPTDADLVTLDQVISELNGLIGGISLETAEPETNVEIHFAPESQFRGIEPNYVPVNYGFFWVWTEDDAIVKSRVLISTNGISQKERSHLIREELTQSLGLPQDSTRYPDSIFQSDWTETVQFSPVDRAAIRLLYDPGLKPGMTRRQVENVLAAR